MYSKIKLHGYCDVNYVWSKGGDLDETEIESIISNGIHSPVWDANTVTLSTFQDNINGNTNVEKNNIVKYVVQRKRIDEDKIYPVAEVSKENTRVYDFNIQNKNKFVYRIIPVLEDATYSSYIESNEVSIDWSHITICDLLPTNIDKEYKVDKNNIWKFSLNIQPTPIKPTFNKRVVSGFGKFPKISQDNTNYLTLGFEALLGDVDCVGKYFNDDIDKMEKWYSFCNNGNIKLLKDLRGNVIPCDIQDTSMQGNDGFVQQFTTLSFNVVQLDDRRNISAYSLESLEV